MYRNRSLKFKIFSVGRGPLVLFLFLSVAAYQTTQSLLETEEWVDHAGGMTGVVADLSAIVGGRRKKTARPKKPRPALPFFRRKRQPLLTE